MLMEILDDWNLKNKLMAVTTNNASDVCNALQRIHSAFAQRKYTSLSLSEFHVRCMPHAIN